MHRTIYKDGKQQMESNCQGKIIQSYVVRYKMKHQIKLSDVVDTEIWDSKEKVGLEIRWENHHMWVEMRDLDMVS